MKPVKIIILALIACLASITVAFPSPSISNDDLTLLVTPDHPVEGGDVVGFSFSGGTPDALLFVFVGFVLQPSNLGEITLSMEPPFLMLNGGLINENGLATGGLLLPGSGPIPGLSGSPLFIEGVTAKPNGSDVIFQKSNLEVVHLL